MIRPVEPRDAEAWARLRGRLWPDAEPADLLRETRAFLAGGVVPTLSAAFVAQIDSLTGPVGFLELALRPFADGCDSMPVPHVEGWYVAPAARGRGNGRALMRAAENWARERGYTELASDTEVENETSLHVHQKCGFDEVERLVKLRKRLA